MKLSINQLVEICKEDNERDKITLNRILEKEDIIKNSKTEENINSRKKKISDLQDTYEKMLISAKLFDGIEDNPLDEQPMTKWTYGNTTKEDREILLQTFNIMSLRKEEARELTEESQFLNTLSKIFQSINILDITNEEDIDYERYIRKF